jgi:cytochrome P450
MMRQPVSTAGTRRIPSLWRTRLCPPLLLWNMMRRPLDFLTRVGCNHDLVRLGSLGVPYYLVCHPDLIRQMLADPKRFQKGSIFGKLQLVLGKGLVTLDGDAWIEARRRVQQAFRPGLLAKQQEIVARHTRALIDRLALQSGSVIDLDALTSELMLRVALELLFGSSPEIVDLEQTRRAVDTCNAYARYRIWSMTPEAWNTPRKRHFLKALALLEAIVDRVVEQRRRETAARRDARCDVLSLLFQAGFEGVELRDHVMTMFVAGHETTAGSVAFLLGLLARHDDVQQRVADEAGEFGDSPLTSESAPWTDAAWRETLRLYPSVPMLDRRAAGEARLGDYRIPAGANLLWSPYAMHRKYCAEPERFDPSRFIDGNTLPPGCFIPFGEGPRMCIGKSLADMEGLTVTALLTRVFRIEPADEEQIMAQPLITLRPKRGFFVRLTPRPGAIDELPAEPALAGGA